MNIVYRGVNIHVDKEQEQGGQWEASWTRAGKRGWAHAPTREFVISKAQDFIWQAMHKEKANSTMRSLTRPRRNPFGASLLEAGLVVGGAVVAGLGYISQASAQKACADALLAAPNTANGLPFQQGSQGTIGEVGFVGGLAILGGGLGSVAAGKVGGVVGALVLPAAGFGIQYLMNRAK